MKNTNISPEKAFSISKYLDYEIEMMSAMVDKIDKGVEKGYERNAYIESFAIHVRNLVSFLYTDTIKSDDVLAVHFFDDSEKWIKIRPSKTKLLQENYVKINKKVAHLSYKRRDYKRGWKYKLIAHHIYIVLLIFLHHADEERIGDIGKNILSTALSKVINYQFQVKHIYEKPRQPVFGNIRLDDFYGKVSKPKGG